MPRVFLTTKEVLVLLSPDTSSGLISQPLLLLPESPSSTPSLPSLQPPAQSMHTPTTHIQWQGMPGPPSCSLSDHRNKSLGVVPYAKRIHSLPLTALTLTATTGHEPQQNCFGVMGKKRNQKHHLPERVGSRGHSRSARIRPGSL